MRKSVIPCFVFLCVFVLVLGSHKPVEAKKVPNFWIRNLEGDRFDTRRHKGPYVLSFFFVNCIPCIKEIPELHAMMSKEFPGSKLLFIDSRVTEDQIYFGNSNNLWESKLRLEEFFTDGTKLSR